MMEPLPTTMERRGSRRIWCRCWCCNGSRTRWRWCSDSEDVGELELEGARDSSRLLGLGGGDARLKGGEGSGEVGRRGGGCGCHGSLLLLRQGLNGGSALTGGGGSTLTGGGGRNLDGGNGRGQGGRSDAGGSRSEGDGVEVEGRGRRHDEVDLGRRRGSRPDQVWWAASGPWAGLTSRRVVPESQWATGADGPV
jgi:hypothetical protein